MTLGRVLALTNPWWMWKDKTVTDAVVHVHLKTWLPLVESALARNATEGRRPASFRDLPGPLDRTQRSLDRTKEGDWALTHEVAIGLSVALGIPLQSLFPTSADWLSGVVCRLCGPCVCPKDASVYVAYRIAVPAPRSTELEPAALLKLERDFGAGAQRPAELEKTILKVAGVLGTVLERLQKGNDA